MPSLAEVIEFFAGMTKPREAGIEIGISDQAMNRTEVLTESQLQHHVHIVGASGFGKSVLLSHIMKSTIAEGKGLLFIDLKSERETIETVRRFAKESGREKDLLIFSMADFSSFAAASYSPFNNGTANQLRDRIMTSFEWSEEFYKNTASSFLLKALMALEQNEKERGEPFGLHELFDLLSDPKFLKDLAMKLKEMRIKVQTETLYRWLSEKSNFEALSGLRVQLESLVLSDFGEKLNVERNIKVPGEMSESAESPAKSTGSETKTGTETETNTKPKPKSKTTASERSMNLKITGTALGSTRQDPEIRGEGGESLALQTSDRGESEESRISSGLQAMGTGSVDLFRAVEEKQIIYMLLDSRTYSESSKALGRLILQDLKAVSAKIDKEIARENRKPFTVVIDEFSDLASDDFASFLDRARSSKMSIVVAHQELSDLARVSPEFQGRLMGNMSTTYCFQQKLHTSAELIAKMAGTKTVRISTDATERFLWFDLSTGKKSVRTSEEFLIHPNVIKKLRVGECVVVKKYPRAEAYRVKVRAEE